MDIKRSGSRRSGKGPAEWFTGTVRIDPLFVHLFPERREAGLSFVVVCDSQNGRNRFGCSREQGQLGNNPKLYL